MLTSLRSVSSLRVFAALRLYPPHRKDWDHVSWPGNDYFGGSRCTDDGVKSAATDSMAVFTGIEGHYDSPRGVYLPPDPYRTWEEVVRQNGLRL